jgi:hypothetical protein
MLSFSHFKGIIKLYTSILHGIAQGMYNYRFCNDFMINSSQLNDYEDLMFWFSCNRWNHDPILHPVPRLTLRSTLDLTLHLTLDPTLRAHRSWRLVHWRPLMDESGIWVLCPLIPSSYGARCILDWVVAATAEWHTKTVKKDVLLE